MEDQPGRSASEPEVRADRSEEPQPVPDTGWGSPVPAEYGSLDAPRPPERPHEPARMGNGLFSAWSRTGPRRSADAAEVQQVHDGAGASDGGDVPERPPADGPSQGWLFPANGTGHPAPGPGSTADAGAARPDPAGRPEGVATGPVATGPTTPAPDSGAPAGDHQGLSAPRPDGSRPGDPRPAWPAPAASDAPTQAVPVTGSGARSPDRPAIGGWEIPASAAPSAPAPAPSASAPAPSASVPVAEPVPERDPYHPEPVTPGAATLGASGLAGAGVSALAGPALAGTGVADGGAGLARSEFSGPHDTYTPPTPLPPRPLPPGRPARRPGRARTRMVLRHVDVGTVAKVSVMFYLLVLVVIVVAAVLLWVAADVFGTLPSIEKSVRTLFSLRKFQLHAGAVALYTGAAGVLIAIVGTLANIVLALIYNLISDTVGGIRVELESFSRE